MEGALEGSGQHLRSWKSTWTEREEVKVTGKKAEESSLQSCGEAVARGQWSLFGFNHYVSDMVHGNYLARGGCPGGLIHSLSPLSSHGSHHGTLMAFKCLTCAHTILVGLVLSWKEDTGKTLTCSGVSYWDAVSSGAFENTPEGNPGQSSSVASIALGCSQRVSRRKEKRGGGEETPSSSNRPPKMLWSGCRLEKNFQT